MKANTAWNRRPYSPLDRPERSENPYVCQVQPGKREISFAFLDNGAAGSEHTLFYRCKGAAAFAELPLGREMSCRLTELQNLTDYEFFIRRDPDGACSEIRMARTGEVPGTVVNYLHPEDKTYGFSGNYLCSPSICRLPGGRLVSSMDLYAFARPQNLTLLFSSDDEGKTWQYLTELFPCYWGRLFCRGGRLYMLACSSVYGDLQIGVSDDSGETWSAPTVLFRGGCCNTERGFHKAPMPFLEAKGRIWTAVEFGTWETREFSNGVLSAPADCPDYTDPAVWSLTPLWRPGRDPAAPEGEVIAIEGNLVEAPDGTLYDFLRYQDKLCLRLKVNGPEAPLSYADLIPMDINASKFEIQRDPVTGDYFALCSRALKEKLSYRNVLGLFRSPDLVHWRCVADVLGDKDLNTQKVGFQYVTFLMEGSDILYLSRTAWNNANSSHDTNFQTFHRIPDFRSLNGDLL